ncbi:tetratricopeptide repeat protein [Catenuloplanes sp. NPDC051500]|uniref:tetratricopeptide repeat protein n=1 Tax=Catenuloplanes sp. NPDC051500 TaxID=3363959 RepID=UPI0037AE1720
MADAVPLRIFLASPDDLASEREVVRVCVEEHNARRRGHSAVTYEVVGWDQVRGTARRPQEAINELISESHFMVVMFKGKWGSEPGSPWGYTSGTEEELFTGLLELGRAEQPMRDVWIAFLEHESPDDQIASLRERISHRHSVMYESVSGAEELKSRIADRLSTWETLASSKFVRHLELLPSSGKDVLRAANLRLRGEKLVELGQSEAGRESLKESATLGGPSEHLAYARFLARDGDFASALTSTQQAINQILDGASNLYSTLAAEAFAAQAGVLRRDGRHVDAIGRLEQALTLVYEGDAFGQKIRCRILDELGLAYQNVDELSMARQKFEDALTVRRDMSEKLDLCQSLVNLARLEVRARNLQVAAEYADEAIMTLRALPPTALHANAEVLGAQVRLREGRPSEGVSFGERAISLNRQLGNRRGEAIALKVVAQCYRASGRNGEAQSFARACVELNESMGNERGVREARWILDNLDS